MRFVKWSERTNLTARTRDGVGVHLHARRGAQKERLLDGSEGLDLSTRWHAEASCVREEEVAGEQQN